MSKFAKTFLFVAMAIYIVYSVSALPGAIYNTAFNPGGGDTFFGYPNEVSGNGLRMFTLFLNIMPDPFLDKEVIIPGSCDNPTNCGPGITSSYPGIFTLAADIALLAASVLIVIFVIKNTPKAKAAAVIMWSALIILQLISFILHAPILLGGLSFYALAQEFSYGGFGILLITLAIFIILIPPTWLALNIISLIKFAPLLSRNRVGTPIS